MFKNIELQNRIKTYLNRKNLIIAVVSILAIVALNLIFADKEVVPEANDKQVVKTTTPAKYVGGQSLSLIGTVRSFTEAKVTSERSGRVTAVKVTLGQNVSAGQILATLENAAESASVLQAEGQYEAALAAAAQSEVGVDEAENKVRDSRNNALATVRSTYNSTNGILLNSIDTFFASPNSSIPGLRIDGRGYTNQLNSDRFRFQTLFTDWSALVNGTDINSDLRAALQTAKTNVQQVITMVDIFIDIFNTQGSSDRYSEAELQAFSTNFTALRASLINLNSQVDSALIELQSAEEALKRAQISASGGTASASDAQVKQALGSLRAAQANFAKTILRTSIGGTVNSINVRPGDFINAFFEVGVVANNSALEVVTFVSDTEKDFINQGDKVMIEGKYEGLVTQISPAVDSVTKKIEVRIATEATDIYNGDTVRITKEVSTSSEEKVVQVPLTAVKFERDNGFMFKVSDGKLIQYPVELGKILGSSVEIVTGLSNTDEFVVDARGLVDGQLVEVAN